uniref:Uncharacterized protein n=1 Tax=Acrobeloides nanus TaxID=290746 RepID=A0A914CGT0_9BILA
MLRYVEFSVFLISLASAQYLNSNTNNNPACVNTCAAPQSATMNAVSNGCVCGPQGQAQYGAQAGGSGSSSTGSNSNQQPGYLPDYRGDNYTNPQRIKDTQALNAPFFQSIGGEPQYPGGVPPKSQSYGGQTQVGYNGQTQGSSNSGSYYVQSQASSAQCTQCSPAYLRLQSAMQQIDQRIQQSACNAQLAASPTTTCAPITTAQSYINCC